MELQIQTKQKVHNKVFLVIVKPQIEKAILIFCVAFMNVFSIKNLSKGKELFFFKGCTIPKKTSFDRHVSIDVKKVHWPDNLPSIYEILAENNICFQLNFLQNMFHPFHLTEQPALTSGQRALWPIFPPSIKDSYQTIELPSDVQS